MAYNLPKSSGVTTINGDSGSVTGSTITIKTGLGSNTCGETIKFVNSGTTSTLNVTDTNDNTTFGGSAGHSGQSGSENVGMGSLALGSLTSGSQNTALGRATSYFLTTGSNNTCLGHSTCESLVTGSSNVCIGSGAGGTYNGAESDNILISNNGVNGESGVTRIGIQGTQTSCYIAGITGVTNSNTQLVTINSSTGQMGVVALIGGTTVSSIDSGSAVSLTTATAKNVTSISLVAGTYCVSGIINFTGTPTVTGPQLASIGTTTNTIGTQGLNAISEIWVTTDFSTGDVSLTLPPYILTLGSTTTVYLVAQGTFTAGALSAYGSISAIRLA